MIVCIVFTLNLSRMDIKSDLPALYNVRQYLKFMPYIGGQNFKKLYDFLNFILHYNLLSADKLLKILYIIRRWFYKWYHRLNKLESRQFTGETYSIAKRESIDMLLYQISTKYSHQLHLNGDPSFNESQQYFSSKKNGSSGYYPESFRTYEGYVNCKIIWNDIPYHIVYWGTVHSAMNRNVYSAGRMSDAYLGIWSKNIVDIDNLLFSPQLTVDRDQFYIYRQNMILSSKWNDMKDLNEIYHKDLSELHSVLNNFDKKCGQFEKTKRLHILLEGAPGCGKTQTAYSIAKRLHLPIYTNTDLSRVIDVIGKFNGIVLIDELETIIDENDSKNSPKKTNNTSITYNPYSKKVYLSDLLTILDNPFPIAYQVIIFCCNDPSKLDKRLLRAGRIDIRIKYDPLTGDVLENMLKDYLGHILTPEKIKDLATNHKILPSLVEAYRYSLAKSDELHERLITESNEILSPPKPKVKKNKKDELNEINPIAQMMAMNPLNQSNISNTMDLAKQKVTDILSIKSTDDKNDKKSDKTSDDANNESDSSDSESDDDDDNDDRNEYNQQYNRNSEEMRTLVPIDVGFFQQSVIEPNMNFLINGSKY